MLATDEVAAQALIPEQDLLANVKPKAKAINLSRFEQDIEARRLK